MALNGRLEDMNLLEILQIVAFSKKTGTLDVRGERVAGAVLFREGRLLCAFSTSTASAVRALAGAPLGDGERALLSSSIRTSLRELLALREGKFEFRLCSTLPAQWNGIDASTFLREEGLDPQEILLELAKSIDEERRDSTRLLETSEELEEEGDEESPAPEAPSPEIPGLTVLVVDDEPLVVQIVSQELDDAGCTVESASGVEEAMALLSPLLSRAQGPVALLIDAGMPTLEGEGLDGGFEVIEHLRGLGGSASVLLMAESLSPRARGRARSLGVERIAFKPMLTKLDPDEYGADLRAFARAIRGELASISRGSASGGNASRALPEPSLNHEAIFDFLRTMTDRLQTPASGITRVLLRVAAKYVERSILFLVKEGRARGLAGAHIGRPEARALLEARAISFEIQRSQPFAEVVYSRAPVRVAEGGEVAIPGLDPGRAREAALFPLLHSHEVLAVLYCDNPATGAPLPKLAGLSLFLVQAGMALENASLHRKLRAVTSRYSIEDQGPLTQELTPIRDER